MKKFASLLVLMTLCTSTVFAAEGEIGHFGGITTGVKLPTTASLKQDKKKTTVSRYVLPYKENVYLTGKPITLEGTLEVRPAKIDLKKGVGTSKETYVYKAESEDGESKLTRSLTLDTEYVYDEQLKQLRKNSTISKWSETVVIEGKTYLLDGQKSSFSKSILEDQAPAVNYYRGDIHYEAIYKNVSDNNTETKVVVSSPIYGFENAFSKVETQKREINVDGQYYILETPATTVYKDLQYGANEPQAISFSGTYKEVIKGEGSLVFNMLQAHPSLYEDEMKGSLNIEDAPSLEQLNSPSLTSIKGHPAETHIRKMYSMGVFEGDGTRFNPNQEVKKKEYIAMLVRALQIPMEEEKKSSYGSKKEPAVTNPFTDLSTSDPYYPYALAAYKAGLVGKGAFNGNKTLTREELFTFNVRAIGLERLGIGASKSYTPFEDDKNISSWAKASVYAATQLGIIPVSNGQFYPKKKVTYAECAVFLDQYFNYLRYGLQKDYNEKMLM